MPLQVFFLFILVFYEDITDLFKKSWNEIYSGLKMLSGLADSERQGWVHAHLHFSHPRPVNRSHSEREPQ
jgi:hypothetical protein